MLAVLLVAVLAVVAMRNTGDDKATAAPSSTAGTTPTQSDSAGPASASSSTSTSAPSSSANTDLAGLLETPAEIDKRMKTAMVASPTESGTAPLADLTVTPAECTGNFMPATAATYAGVKFTAMAVQGFRGPGNSVTASVIEAVVRFPDAAAAKSFFNDQFSAWASCNYKPVSAHYADGASYDAKTAATGKTTTSEGDTISTSVFRTPMPPKGTAPGCDRALGLTGDVVSDVVVCLDGNVGGYGTGLARSILRKAH